MAFLRKLPEKFKGVVEYNNATKDFKNLVYNNIEICAFANF